MRVGFVRNVALGMVALVGLGLAGCDDNPTDFETDETVRITTNPSVMIVPAGVTTLLESRTENAGNEPTWEEIEATVDPSCVGAGQTGTASVAVAANFEPSIQPPGQFDVTGGTTLGQTCVELEGGGVTATVELTIVGDSLAITNAPDTLTLFDQVQLGAVLTADDGTPVSPFDPTTDVVWETDNEEVLTVDQTGLVTSVGGIGGGVITATWTDAGIDQAATATIAINSPTLNILNAPATGDSLLILTSVDLDVELVNPTDPPFDFGPFDQATDVTWSSSAPGTIEVDEQTGEATAVGPGTATITVTWNETDAITASVDIDVDAGPAPVVSSTDVTSADALDVVTITGTDFFPGVHTVLIDGARIDDFYAPTVVNTTTATFMMPGGAAEDVEVSVGFVVAASNAVTVSRTCGAIDESCGSEPDNDGAAGAPDVGALPISFAGFVDGADPNDLLEFTLAAETTFDISLDWTGNSGDLDAVWTLTGATDYSEGACGFPTATGAQPETGQCTLPAGTYYIWVTSYDAELAFYQLDLTEVP